MIALEQCKDPHLGLRTAEVRFKSPYFLYTDYELVALAVMRLLMKYAYTIRYSYKFTFGYTMKIPTGEVPLTTGRAICLMDSSGKNAVPKMEIYDYTDSEVEPSS